jgi:ceramide glucosyltransferase
MPGWAAVAVQVVLGACLLGYLFYAALSVWAARQWSWDRPAVSNDWTPAVTILKPVRGVDAEAWENFCSFCLVDYPRDRLQILFGALDADDPALELARRLQSEFPDVDIGIIAAPKDAVPGNNRKVCNLLAMLPHARYDLLVLCDSDMRVRPDYLRRIVAPFQDGLLSPEPGSGSAPGSDAQSSTIVNPDLGPARVHSQTSRPVGLVTCPYRGAAARSFAARLETLGIGADFIPSTLVSRALEGVSFALGSTIVVPRLVLDEIGGFEPLRDELADDFRLGNGVWKAGYRVVLSDYVIDDVLGAESFGAMWSRRLRWARTLRVCRPAGYAGTLFTHGFPFALLFLVVSRFSVVGWGIFGLVTAVRLLAVLTITLRCTGDRGVLRYLPLLPISDLIGVALFVTSYLGRHILWRGERFRLVAGGRLVRDE